MQAMTESPVAKNLRGTLGGPIAEQHFSLGILKIPRTPILANRQTDIVWYMREESNLSGLVVFWYCPG